MLKLKLQYFGHLSEELTHWKRLWCWEGLGAGGEGDNRGWDGWMASRTRWTRVWVNSGSWWWTGRPDVLRFMGSQRVGHDWATELNWTEFPFPFWKSHFDIKIIFSLQNELVYDVSISVKNTDTISSLNDWYNLLIKLSESGVFLWEGTYLLMQMCSWL